MKLTKVDIQNFRGIESTQVELRGDAPGKVVTLIGLNESGKTTILEALSNFVSRDTETTSLVETYYTKVDASSFVPKHRRGRFTDKVSIKCDAILSDDDVDHVITHVKSLTNLAIDKSSVSRRVVIEKEFKFKDSSLVEQSSLWTISFSYRKGKGIKLKSHSGASDPAWKAAIGALRGRVPEIVYFPTFLFDVPDRIYLTDDSKESIQNSYYRRVLRDVLKTVDPDYSIEAHITGRVEAAASASQIEKFFRALLGASVEGDVDTVVREMSNKISQVIIGAWDEIFGRKLINKRIELSWDLDPDKSNAVYVELYIIDGQSKYLLRERSLGFRWFFSFLLFTQFRRRAGKPSIFLFDEPASHLHSGAQIKLLENFPRIAGDDDLIVYSTHSHYMVNPQWLEKAYIVDNKAIDLSSDEVDQFSTNPNNIVAIPYKRFVSDNPTRISYFQPVFDALQYQISPMHFRGPAVFVEGKFDYYPFMYLQSRLPKSQQLAVFPLNGAGDVGPLSTLFRGWAISFVALLDADKGGKREKVRYRAQYDLTENQVCTLDELCAGLDGLSFEGMYGDDVKKLIAEHEVGRGKMLKEDASILFQLLLATNDTKAKLANTLKTFAALHEGLRARLKAQP
jgi:hypothetical protein